MEIKTAIAIAAYGDFDVKYTDKVMITEEVRDVKSIVKNYCNLRGIPGTSGLPNNMISDVREDFVKFLKKEGFRELKTTEVCFSD